jgi:hypothetical protein
MTGLLFGESFSSHEVSMMDLASQAEARSSASARIIFKTTHAPVHSHPIRFVVAAKAQIQ